jgi:hypothetical protein
MVPEPAEEMIVHNLIEALERLRADLDRVELLTAALGCFQQPVPPYELNDRYLLSAKPKSERSRARV